MPFLDSWDILHVLYYVSKLTKCKSLLWWPQLQCCSIPCMDGDALGMSFQVKLNFNY